MFSSLEARKTYSQYKTDHSLLKSHNSSTKSNDHQGLSYFGSSKRDHMSRQVDQLAALFRFRKLNHFLFWAIVVFISAYHGSLFGGTFYDNLINMLVLVPTQMMVAYILVYHQVPKLLLEGKWMFFFFHFIAVTYAASIVARLSIIYIAEPIIGREGIDESIWEIISDPIYLVKVYTIIVCIPAIVMFLIKMTSERFKQEKQVQNLRTEKRNMELNFLKAQMNPHFLFNTLNNIYALAKAESKDTPEMILKLSAILDYTIYDCQSKTVPISKEWELIEAYADLQAMRSMEPINLILSKSIDTPDIHIAPLLLISLVENAFKYAMQGKLPEIRIDLRVASKTLELEVYNSKPSLINAPPNEKQKGIGINNVRSQLLLLYPQKHSVVIDETETSYFVKLKISL